MLCGQGLEGFFGGMGGGRGTPYTQDPKELYGKDHKTKQKSESKRSKPSKRSLDNLLPDVQKKHENPEVWGTSGSRFKGWRILGLRVKGGCRVALVKL